MSKSDYALKYLDVIIISPQASLLAILDTFVGVLREQKRKKE